jgi:hypothetical protein
VYDLNFKKLNSYNLKQFYFSKDHAYILDKETDVLYAIAEEDFNL